MRLTVRHSNNRTFSFGRQEQKEQAMGALSRTELESYQREGYLLKSDLFTVSEIDRLAQAVATEAEHLARKGNRKRKSGTNQSHYDVLHEASLHDPDINFIVDHPKILGTVERLLGRPARLSAFAIHIKRPGWSGTVGDYQGSLQDAHCDYKPFRPVGSSLNWLFIIIPLVDYTEDIGPLLISPGSLRFSQFLPGEGRVTHVGRAHGGEIPSFVDLKLKRGQVVFMSIFTWHQAYANRSNRIRYGVYNKYMADNAPPGSGPYIFSDESYRFIKKRGSDLLANHSNRIIAFTYLLLVKADRVLFLRGASGKLSLPGGSARTEPKCPGSDDDNVIAYLYDHLREQMNLDLPWVSYVGDYLEDDHLCRVYAFPLEDSPNLHISGSWGGVWLSEQEITQAYAKSVLPLGLACEATASWLHEPLLRGIGQTNPQARNKT